MDTVVEVVLSVGLSIDPLKTKEKEMGRCRVVVAQK